jgi:hypothetical protein
MKKLHIINIEPDTYMMFIDGERYDRGDRYMKEDTLIELLEKDEQFSVTTEHMHFNKWRGAPKTLEEAEEMYDDVDGYPNSDSE